SVQRAAHDLALFNGLGGLRQRSEDREERADIGHTEGLAAPGASQLSRAPQLVVLAPAGNGDGERSAVLAVALTEGHRKRGRTPGPRRTRRAVTPGWLT